MLDTFSCHCSNPGYRKGCFPAPLRCHSALSSSTQQPLCSLSPQKTRRLRSICPPSGPGTPGSYSLGGPFEGQKYATTLSEATCGFHPPLGNGWEKEPGSFTCRLSSVRSLCFPSDSPFCSPEYSCNIWLRTVLGKGKGALAAARHKSLRRRIILVD